MSSLELYDYGDTFYGWVVAIGTSLLVVIISLLVVMIRAFAIVICVSPGIISLGMRVSH